MNDELIAMKPEGHVAAGFVWKNLAATLLPISF